MNAMRRPTTDDYATPAYVEARLRAAMTTLRRLPMPRNGRPPLDRSHWPEIVRDAADRAGWIIAAGPEHLKAQDRDRNRVRLAPSARAIHELDECLNWLHFIRDRRRRKVVFARSHIHEESDRPVLSWRVLAERMGVHEVTLRRWYGRGIDDIVRGLNTVEK